MSVLCIAPAGCPLLDVTPSHDMDVQVRLWEGSNLCDIFASTWLGKTRRDRIRNEIFLEKKLLKIC
jgi:hypothetical protein